MRAVHDDEDDDYAVSSLAQARLSRQLVAHIPRLLDFKPDNFHLQQDNGIRAPLMRTPIVSANLVMSDHLSRAWRDGMTDRALPFKSP
jgi:hypothetical protein